MADIALPPPFGWINDSHSSEGNPDLRFEHRAPPEWMRMTSSTEAVYRAAQLREYGRSAVEEALKAQRAAILEAAEALYDDGYDAGCYSCCDSTLNEKAAKETALQEFRALIDKEATT